MNTSPRLTSGWLGLPLALLISVGLAVVGAQIASPALYGGAIALVIVLCVVHAFRGLGMIGGAC